MFSANTPWHQLIVHYNILTTRDGEGRCNSVPERLPGTDRLLGLTSSSAKHTKGRVWLSPLSSLWYLNMVAFLQTAYPDINVLIANSHFYQKGSC